MPPPMRVFHIVGDQFTELEALPEALPPRGYLWVAQRAARVRGRRRRRAGARCSAGPAAQLFDLHVSDLLNKQLPSNFDYTSVVRPAGVPPPRRRRRQRAADRRRGRGTPATARRARSTAIDTSPVGFAVFDRVLLTVHPTDCQVREFFANRLQNQAVDRRGPRRSARMPTSPADLMLRMVNYMVDSYLELRRLLTRAARLPAGAAVRPAQPLRRLAHAARLAQRAAPARGHLRGPARGDRRMDRRARRMARAERRRGSGASASSCGCARATCSSTSSAC